ncbi:hypothetical protein FRX31_017668 [Thalictrum thalictroides]|uniref:Uncharacterized protein n=1 Tax=Thalictrum thalictroides TaxID=46969 RepID=A0A7J6W5W2_THATH|nr:hypothetical protein FRX31_017668 [Thalictrum thalictroides]
MVYFHNYDFGDLFTIDKVVEAFSFPDDVEDLAVGQLTLHNYSSLCTPTSKLAKKHEKLISTNILSELASQGCDEAPDCVFPMTKTVVVKLSEEKERTLKFYLGLSKAARNPWTLAPNPRLMSDYLDMKVEALFKLIPLRSSARILPTNEKVNGSALKVEATQTSKGKSVASLVVKDTPTGTRFTRSQGRELLKAVVESSSKPKGVVSGKRRAAESINLDESDKAQRSLDTNVVLVAQL